MQYDITLKITYEYDNPVDSGRHVICVKPANLPGEQSVVLATLDIQPKPAERIERVDFFGNACTEIVFHKAVSDTLFRMKSRVDRFLPEPLLDVSPNSAGLQREIASIRSVDPLAPHHFRFGSPRVSVDAITTDWAKRIVGDASSVFSAANRICDALHDEMTFDVEATVVDTPYLEAFQMRRGVCQDFTHIAIAALRGIGIPAGYVSGFLRTIPPHGVERLAGADAMHAWVRAWCGVDMGWVEFDPTNAMLAGADHIVIARGRDYFDVAPVSGAMRMSGAQTTNQAVDVLPVR
jgi:transglutaminase-like putative cysteine protease